MPANTLVKNTLPTRTGIDGLYRANEETLIQELREQANFSRKERSDIFHRAVKLIKAMRTSGKPGLMDLFLAEYGLSTEEGIALMCLAEALLRVPDQTTIDLLIEDKIAPHEWGSHFGASPSARVNASTFGLMMTGGLLGEKSSKSGLGILRQTVKRLGAPVVRAAVKRAMAEMGGQFVLGQTIEEAIARGRAARKQGYLYSYDMLGEAALTQKDTDAYFQSYWRAIEAIGKESRTGDIQTSPGVSVKLSALHPRFEYAKRERLAAELTPRVLELAQQAKALGIGFNIDAEEANRLSSTLDVFEALLKDDRLAGWDGLGLVIQAYGKRASAVIDWLYEAAKAANRKVMVRLVKGAYWDAEVKQAQVDGVSDFPVFTSRAATDISYMACVKKLLGTSDHIYPQFATHNAQTAATVLELAKDGQAFEFQRLHGMGEALHEQLIKQSGVRSRIYAPVGPHKDLLAYLVRRLLENGANSSFVNQVVDPKIPAEEIAEDPLDKFDARLNQGPSELKNPADLFQPERINSKGWDLSNPTDIANINDARRPFTVQRWSAEPILAGKAKSEQTFSLFNPADPNDQVGRVTLATKQDAQTALEASQSWKDPARIRASVLNRAADFYEEHYGELFAVLAREAGKTQADAVAELREAVDFLRYYAARALELTDERPVGCVTCISPWNFPLAIFTGQIAAALAAGNGVIAKPAEATPLVASVAVKFLHEAGVPIEALQFLPGEGRTIGHALTANDQIGGVCFTGSTKTAHTINRALAEHGRPEAFLIAETGGLNAAIVDSTALPEQAVRDVIASAFQSAGQRCSALRSLYIQDDIADGFLQMLIGAMEELRLGNPWTLDVDIGPVISAEAERDIQAYVDEANADDRLLKQLRTPLRGHFVGPALIEVSSIKDLPREVFGPVLHVARFKAEDFDQILKDINNSGYGLTFGLHTRIDERIQKVSDTLRVGNIYVNRNQVGAIVGSQPFGGEGLSGTGPKAGGPHYVQRFTEPTPAPAEPYPVPTLSRNDVQAVLNVTKRAPETRLSKTELPGPTGETNELALWPRGLVLCLGPGLDAARAQAAELKQAGGASVIIAPGAAGPEGLNGVLDLQDLQTLDGFSAVALWSDKASLRIARQALANRDGPLMPLITSKDVQEFCVLERHVCIDTTAAGGNASLLADAF